MIAIIKKWYYQQKELSLQRLEAALMVEKMNNQLNSERSRIAADMHDDMGAGLSRMRYLSAAMQYETNDEAMKKELEKLINNSDELVGNMNEIIWTLNNRDETLADALFYIRSQCAEMVSNANIEFACIIQEEIPALTLNSKQARNIYLLAKEAVNNAIKHADAKSIAVNFSINHALHITVKDDGKGFDQTTVRKEGNGLLNYKKRVETLAGTYNITTSPGIGTEIIFTIPLSPAK